MAPDFIDYSSIFNNKINLFLTQVDDYWDDGYPHSRKDQIIDILKLKHQKVLIPKQIHSDIVTHISQDIKNLECDAIIFNSNDIIGSINVADCVPICIYDTDRGTISLIHSGWKGALRGIISKVIKFMIKKGSKTKNITAVIGPSISVKNYEVQKDFYNKFIRKDKTSHKFF